MDFNVAQQLREPVGSEHEYILNEQDVELEQGQPASNVTGRVVFLRTDKGLLVTASLLVTVQQVCGRCLERLVSTEKVEFQEEYLPTVDIVTGAFLPPPEDANAFRIDPHHILDIKEAVRQYLLTVKPIRPLCRPDCAGLCPHCGHNLNTGPCGCPKAVTDERWSALEELTARLRD